MIRLITLDTLVSGGCAIPRLMTQNNDGDSDDIYGILVLPRPSTTGLR
jgi:hypothetical protein